MVWRCGCGALLPVTETMHRRVRSARGLIAPSLVEGATARLCAARSGRELQELAAGSIVN
jgi:hypothetical protein